MRRYRTEIVIPPDRYLGLQLPSNLPLGRAIVSITVEEPDPAELAAWYAVASALLNLDETITKN